MKKDKQWAISELTKSINFFKAAARNGFSIDYFYGKELGTREAIQILEKLDEPETLTPEWIDERIHYSTDQDAFGNIVRIEMVPAKYLQNLLVPKQEVTEEQALRKIVEKYPLTPNDIPWILDRYVANVLVEQPKKPVIPRYVADLMEDYNDASIQSFLSDAFRNYREGRADRDDAWITKNSADFVDAYRYGYTVEEEQKYRVLDGNTTLLGRINGLILTTVEILEYYPEYDPTFEFTEQEIKDYDPRYMTFAKPVEELKE